jgi:WD40 repeat protein
MLKVLVPLALIVMMVSTVYAAPPTQLWSDAVGTNDIALSKDGNYVAVASGNQLRFYGRTSGTPLWTHTLSSGDFRSVAPSADGDCVVAGISLPDGGKVLFWKNSRTLTGNPASSWMSENLGGGVYRRCLDISEDGNYVVACGTGRWVFYWANTKILSGADKPWTWRSVLFSSVECVDLSSDGDYVAAGIVDYTLGDMAAYWKNTRTLTGNDRNPDWKSSSPDNSVSDVAISDDGNYIAVATGADLSVHYWANAKSLTGDPAHTWYYGSGTYFSSIDMSSDGNSVIASSGGGVPNIAPQKGDTSKAALGVTGGVVYFWSGAKGLTGKPQNPTWTYATKARIHDVAIDDVGAYMAADANILIPGEVYFFNSGGTLLWSYPIDLADKVSISGDGATLAVGTSAQDTGYLLSTGFSSGNLANPVGGLVMPTNKLEIVAPVAALAGLAAVISAVVAVKRRRD